jgi:hypothetical protein
MPCYETRLRNKLFDATITYFQLSTQEMPVMKLIIAVTICFSTFIILSGSCKKEKADKGCIDLSNSLAGTWELRQTSAAMNPVVSNYPAGNGNILKFMNDNYEKYSNGQLVSSGRFSIVSDPTVETSICLVFPAGQFSNRIVYDSNNSAPKEFIQISNGKLIFISGCYALDAGQKSEYQRQ